jgi:phospholipid/cholesterol/gamma-HCH transport system substrate-binding protein
VKARTWPVAAVAALVAGLVTTGCSLQPNDHTLPGQKGAGGDGYTVTVVFDDVENLVANSPVQRDDVTVGTVTRIRVRDWQARVTLRLAGSERIPADATFAIGQKTLLGAQYVEIDEPARPSSADVLADGAVVPVGQTGSYPQTEQVLGAASLLLNNGGLSQISTITGQLTRSLGGRVPDTRDLVRRLNDLLGVLDRNKGAIVDALDSLDRLSAGFAAQSSTVARALRTIGPGLRALNQERQALVSAVVRTGDLSGRAVEVVTSNEQAILGSVDALRPILGRLSEVSSQLPEALKIAITVPFPVMTTDQAVSGDYANLFATVDVSLPALLANFGRVSQLPPALQAGDPLRGPLAPTPPASPPVVPKVPGHVPGQSATPSGGTTTPPAPDKPCSLLTALLGGCR